MRISGSEELHTPPWMWCQGVPAPPAPHSHPSPMERVCSRLPAQPSCSPRPGHCHCHLRLLLGTASIPAALSWALLSLLQEFSAPRGTDGHGSVPRTAGTSLQPPQIPPGRPHPLECTFISSSALKELHWAKSSCPGPGVNPEQPPGGAGPALGFQQCLGPGAVPGTAALKGPELAPPFPFADV